MRLIDADMLLEKLKSEIIELDEQINYNSQNGIIDWRLENHRDHLNYVVREVANQPTAYDVDKVIEKIESIKVGAGTDCRHNCQHYDWYVGACKGFCEHYTREEAIDIVKGGGVDEID